MSASWVIGVNIFEMDFGVQVGSVKQPINRNSVGSGYVSHCRASSLYDHLDHSFVVFKNVKYGARLRRFRV